MSTSIRRCKLVLGNGFDLYCGMETTFKQYLDATTYKYIEDFESNMNSVIDEYTDYHSNDFTIDQIGLFIEKINIWDYILYIFSTNRKYWYDFEKILQDFLINRLKEVNSYYSLICKTINSFYQNRELLRDCFEKENFKIALVYGLFNGFDQGDSSSYYFDELIKFENKFGNYINNLFVQNKNNMVETIIPFFDELHRVFDISSIDTFNYTPIENEDYFIKQSNMIYHINGSTLNHPIFGYDYTEKDKLSEKFSKTFRRIRSYDYCESYSNQYPLIEEFDDLVIFGHSLCEMDYSYYFPIFNYIHILESNFKNRIIIYYHNDSTEDRRTTLIFSLKKMLDQYSCEIEGKVNKRLLDSLSIQGRILFIPVPQKKVLENDENI